MFIISSYCFDVPAVDCSSASLSYKYMYTLPSNVNLGDTMSVSCAPYYEWSVSPYTGSQTYTATCTNLGGVGTWVIDSGYTCNG